MFLSVIVPVYNTEKYLKECLDSLLDQDISSDDYEIICVDDGSTDSSLSILEQYQNEYSNVIGVSQKNGGVSAARNHGMSIAKGEFYWFVDSDDIVQPQILGKLKSLISSQNYEWLSCKLKTFDNESMTLNQLKSGINASDLTGESVRTQACMLISSKTIGHVLWHKGIEVGEDEIFMRECLLKKPRMLETEDVIYYYRQQPNSAIHSVKNMPSRMKSHVDAAIIMKSIYDSPNGKCEANANIMMGFVINAMYMISKYPGSESKRELKRLKGAGLFPFKRPKECTKKQSFIVGRDDLKGRIIDAIIMNSGNYAGYIALRVYQSIRIYRS